MDEPPAKYLNTAIFGFFLAFILTPFSVLGYIFVFTILATEIFYHFYCEEALCYPTRMFIILITVFGRLLGEVFWAFVARQGFKAVG